LCPTPTHKKPRRKKERVLKEETKMVRKVPARTTFCRGMLRLNLRKERLETGEMLSCRMDAKISSHGIACPSTRTPVFAMPYHPNHPLQAYSALLSLQHTRCMFSWYLQPLAHVAPVLFHARHTRTLTRTLAYAVGQTCCECGR